MSMSSSRHGSVLDRGLDLRVAVGPKIRVAKNTDPRSLVKRLVHLALFPLHEGVLMKPLRFYRSLIKELSWFNYLATALVAVVVTIILFITASAASGSGLIAALIGYPAGLLTFMFMGKALRDRQRRQRNIRK